MEKEFVDKYEKLLSHDEQFSITKDDLLNLVNEKNLETVIMNLYVF